LQGVPRRRTPANVVTAITGQRSSTQEGLLNAMALEFLQLRKGSGFITTGG
ncbi:hypothetical protein A2U01_0049255, partial [Trifolium medium]|nr:hypothetical protein [Trifolium medium]